MLGADRLAGPGDEAVREEVVDARVEAGLGEHDDTRPPRRRAPGRGPRPTHSWSRRSGRRGSTQAASSAACSGAGSMETTTSPGASSAVSAGSVYARGSARPVRPRASRLRAARSSVRCHRRTRSAASHSAARPLPVDRPAPIQWTVPLGAGRRRLGCSQASRNSPSRQAEFTAGLVEPVQTAAPRPGRPRTPGAVAAAPPRSPMLASRGSRDGRLSMAIRSSGGLARAAGGRGRVQSVTRVVDRQHVAGASRRRRSRRTACAAGGRARRGPCP